VWKTSLTAAGKLMFEKCNILIMDELSKFKHTDTQRFKIIKPWLHKFDRRYGLTGSPAANGLLDLFGQCFVLDGGRSLGPYITHYREQYFTPVDKEGFTYRLKHGADQLIYDRLKPLALRMDAEDHLELPQMRTLPIKMELPPAVRRAYDEMEDDFLTLIQNEILTSPNAASSKMMLRQMCSGAVYKNQMDHITGLKRAGKREWMELHSEKLDALEDLMDELQGQQMLIGYDFQHDLERISKRFPSIPHFGQNEKADKRIESAWNAGELQYVLGHPASMGHGLNLQGSSAHNIAWYTMTWDYELYDQFNRRIRRQGTKAQFINCYQFMMRNTVEESLVAWLLKSKKKTQDDLLNALKLRSRLSD
jgi:SNF2 family DNA or RNA helicase